MRVVCVVAAVALVLLAVPVVAQEVELREYTLEQRWERLAWIMADWQAAVIALGEAQGMTAEEVGAWIGEFWAKESWQSGPDAQAFVRNMHRNLMAMPEAEAEILDTTPDSVTVRFNRPIKEQLEIGEQLFGVSGKQFDAMHGALMKALADGVGIGLKHEVEGDRDVFSFETQYVDHFHVSNDRRWVRGAQLSWNTYLQLISLRKESGMTAREIGEANAELHAPSWAARTPWQLYRGMVWNQMRDPRCECEVITASAEEVHARCRQFYVGLVEQNQERFGVTPEEVFEVSRAFAGGVADYLGLTWTEELEDGWRIITIGRKRTGAGRE